MTVLGCLPYLNVKPLVHTFETGNLPAGWSLTYAPPSELAKMLHSREVAAAPVSSFEVLRSSDLVAVPDVCIASRGPAKSVLLFSRVPFSRIRSVALDTSSLTAAAMVRILFSETFGLSPAYQSADPDPGEMLRQADAALLIGNAAMLFRPLGLRVLDIGQAWRDLTGLPAVFALWAGAPDLLTPDVARLLIAARDEGLRDIDRIADAEARGLSLPRSTCREYLRDVINFRLGDDELASLEKFGELSLKHGLIDPDTPNAGHVRFCDVA